MGIHRVLDFAIGHWTPVDQVGQENDLQDYKLQIIPLVFSVFSRLYRHDNRSKESPGPNPILVWCIACHLLHTLTEFIGSKNPSNGYGLEKATP